MKLKAVDKRVIMFVDIEGKNSHTFSDGTVLKLQRDYNNFNKRYTMPVNGIVIDSEYIPQGASVIFHHNSVHDVNRIFNYEGLTKESSSDVKVYSIPENECYLWKGKYSSDWEPCKGFATGFRVFKPYIGVFEGIKPTIIPKKMFITSGEYTGKVVITLPAADYEMIFQGENGQEERVIRCRHFECAEHEREEIIGIDFEATNKVESGEWLIGIDVNDCKKYVK